MGLDLVVVNCPIGLNLVVQSALYNGPRINSTVSFTVGLCLVVRSALQWA